MMLAEHNGGAPGISTLRQVPLVSEQDGPAFSALRDDPLRVPPSRAAFPGLSDAHDAFQALAPCMTALDGALDQKDGMNATSSTNMLTAGA